MFDNKAFEEAWINACVHNLWDTHISPQIYIFEDRMEIESQGGLPYGLTEKEFLAGISKPVNPDLMDIFKSCRIVERSGHGVPEVVKVYGKSAYKFSTNTITVTIPFDKTGFGQDGTVNGTVNDDMLSNSEKLIMNVISLNGNLTRKEMCKQTNLSLRTVARTLDSLKNKGLIYRVGSDKNGHWEIVVKDEQSEK